MTRVQGGGAEKAPEEPRGGWVMDPRSSDSAVTPGPSPIPSLENPKFPGILARLEESPVCQRLPLTSFLILPFQRITRLKMLVEVPAGHRLQWGAGRRRCHCEPPQPLLSGRPWVGRVTGGRPWPAALSRPHPPEHFEADCTGL